MEILSKQGGAELAGLGCARSWSVLAPRFLGAIALFTVGAVHLHEYNFLYSSIPTIGTLFMLTFISATLIGLGLLAPVERMLGRLGGAALALLAVAGAGQAARLRPTRPDDGASLRAGHRLASRPVPRAALRCARTGRPVVRAKLCCHVRCRE